MGFLADMLGWVTGSEVSTATRSNQLINDAARQIIAQSTEIRGVLHVPTHVVIIGPAKVLIRDAVRAQLEEAICEEVYRLADALSEKHRSTFGTTGYGEVDLSEVEFHFREAAGWNAEVSWDHPANNGETDPHRRHPSGGRSDRPGDRPKAAFDADRPTTAFDADLPTRVGDEMTEPAYLSIQMSVDGTVIGQCPITVRQLSIGRGTGCGLIVPAQFERVSREALMVVLASPTTAKVSVSNRAGAELLGSHNRRPTFTATVIPAGTTQVLGIGEEIRFRGCPDLRLTVVAL